MNEEFEGLNLVELLALLEAPLEPEPISMWPATEGWLWLGGALAAGLAWLAWRMIKRWRAGAYRRAALRALEGADNDAARIALVLRRTALAAYPRARIAALHGEAWLRFLDQSADMRAFLNGPGAALARAAYAETPADPELGRLGRLWVKRHKPLKSEPVQAGEAAG